MIRKVWGNPINTFDLRALHIDTCAHTNTYHPHSEQSEARSSPFRASALIIPVPTISFLLDLSSQTSPYLQCPSPHRHSYSVTHQKSSQDSEVVIVSDVVYFLYIRRILEGSTHRVPHVLLPGGVSQNLLILPAPKYSSMWAVFLPRGACLGLEVQVLMGVFY